MLPTLNLIVNFSTKDLILFSLDLHLSLSQPNCNPFTMCVQKTIFKLLPLQTLNYESLSSRSGLGVEQWSDNRLHSASARVDQSPLGETIPAMSMFFVYMVPTPTDVCYKYK